MIRMNPLRKYNLHTKAFPVLLLIVVPAEFKFSLDYDLTTSNVTPPILSCTSFQTEFGIDFHSQLFPPFMRSPCSSSPKLPSVLVESLISGAGVREAESDFW